MGIFLNSRLLCTLSHHILLFEINAVKSGNKQEKTTEICIEIIQF